MMNKRIAWRKIDRFDGNYSVSSDGRVKNNLTKKEILPIRNKSGYMYVNLRKNSGNYKTPIHRLVGIAFLERKEEIFDEIDHINGIKNDNRVENLRWVTKNENVSNRRPYKRCK